MYRYTWMDERDAASQSGLADVVDLVVEVSMVDPYIGLPPDCPADEVEALRARLRSVIASGRSHVLLIRDDESGAAVGCVVLARSATPNQRHIAELTTGAVHPKHRGMGVVPRAFAEVGALCGRLGVELLRLDVREGIPAERIWRQYGFREYGRLEDYGRIDGVPYSGVFLAQPVDDLLATVSKHLTMTNQEA